MKKRISIFAAALVFCASLNLAQATIINYSTTIDLASFNINNTASFDSWTFNLAPISPTFSFHSGDTIQGTITFSNNQSLLINDPLNNFSEGVFLELHSFSGGGPFTYNTSMTLLDANGEPRALSSGVTNHLDSTLFASFPELTGSSMSFSGFDYSITLVSLLASSTAVEPFDVTIIAAPNGTSIIPTPVPEPGELALAAMGIVGLVGVRRKAINRR